MSRMLKLPEEVKARYDLSSVEYCVSTGSPWPHDLKVVFLHVLLADPTDGDSAPCRICDRQTKLPLSLEDAVGVVTQGAVREERHMRL